MQQMGDPHDISRPSLLSGPPGHKPLLKFQKYRVPFCAPLDDALSFCAPLDDALSFCSPLDDALAI